MKRKGESRLNGSIRGGRRENNKIPPSYIEFEKEGRGLTPLKEVKMKIERDLSWRKWKVFEGGLSSFILVDLIN